MAKKHFFIHPDYLRGAMFGVEDALVSTTGVVAGISAGVSDRQLILLASLVTVSVEALSMGAGQYLSEESVHQMSKKKHTDSLWIGAISMFVAYMLAGLVPVIPLFIFPDGYGIIGSILFAFTGLFILGYVKGKVVHVQATQSAVKILVVGGLATLIGIIVGRYFKIR